ncbi:alpha-beta hydrolase superfamily lysophospholipase [Arthrobacter stackebrandtii]|uniref:Alpha-beta hydrolase superfamily lysophospholipase n=1 Tax=Arthrobacter stackebrandtii TaxID=272161 RepID=A0ABS4YUQ2_9MICC|nr:alpha/beta hydrolase [Arthrobacter stackebrandtii]MBP2412205.1 alpha-beta hydrolase superfamily lysophospholipase [Arthrobacter stackebrandtii]PYH01992.1 alpha/beta hydrolase [Arthrobacter stackebrandtii]
MTSWQQDILGPDFEQLTLDLLEGSPATLVRYAGHAPKWEPSSLTGADILYVHGWSDYFFQRELAEFWHRAGANFYALDLHNYGRSLRPGQVPGQVASLNEYDGDIAAALSAMGRAVPAEGDAAPPVPARAADQQTFERAFLEEARQRLSAAFDALAGRERTEVPEPVPGVRPLVLLGHSTGGLTLSLWAARHPGAAAAVVLNSPWLEFQASEVGRAVVAPLIQARSRFKPHAPLPQIDPGFYTRAVSKKFDGEWEYESQWRPDHGFPVTPSFLNAVFQGQATVARGLGIDVPVLVMLSDKSYLQPKWSSDALAADVVLNVDSVARRSLELGPAVTLQRITGAFHDVFLSPGTVRAQAYAGMGRWVEAALNTDSRRLWDQRTRPGQAQVGQAAG